MMTTNNNRRLPAEWEPQQAVLVAWPHADTDWAYMLDEAQACYVDLISAIARHAQVVVIAPDTAQPRARLAQIEPSRIAFVDIDTNDTWTRDYGPITTLDDNSRPTLNDFCFNGWGMKFAACLDNLATRKLMFSGILSGTYANRLGFVLEGGSIESDGCGTLLTTRRCLLSPNRNGEMSRREISSYLKTNLGARKVLWLDYGALAGDDTDSHIDTLARLAPHNTIVYCGCHNPDDEHYDDLRAMHHELAALVNADGQPFSLVELPLPDPIYDPEDGHRLPATYANFLIINDAVLVPTYGQERNDRLAQQIIQSVFPDRQVEGVDCRALIRQHGSLHCATMQLHTINF